ncbi:MAG TPA: hypothetical protein PLM98_02800 [Thiolinea sp.]|nr:hypothetical protein [Thiolinea sp.]
MSTSEKTTAAPKADAPLIENRFALRRKMSFTALADVYWADDLHTPTQGEQDHIVLLILVAPVLSNISGFSKAWDAVMSRPAPPAVSYPNILDWGNEGANYWFTCTNTQGTLLSEYFNELDKRGLSPDQSFAITETVSHSLSNVQAGAFGYFEPGTTLRTDHGYVLLNAPLVKVMHSLLLQQTGVRAPLALHSAWLSPSVAVGDMPVTEDDSFSMASLYQMLLSQQPPYGQQSTLAALARGTAVTISPKLKPEAQQLLSQALSLQRNQRPENPETLLKGLSRKNHRKLLLPIAALAALGVVVYASYHLVSKFNGLLHETTPTTQVVATPQPTTTSTAPTEPVMVTKDQAKPASETVALVNETAKPLDPNPAATTANVQTPAATADSAADPAAQTVPVAVDSSTSSSTSESLNQAAKQDLTTTAPVTTSQDPQASASVVANTDPASLESNPTTSAATPTAIATTDPASSTNVTEPVVTASNNSAAQAEVTPLILKATDAFNAGNATGTDGTVAILRQVWAIDRQDPNARALLNKVIAQQQQQTESHLNLNKLAEAKTALAQTDDLIREFTLTDRIEEQVRLESQIDIREREQREAGDLVQQAKAAIKRGELSKEDGNNNAMAYLNKLMFASPNNAEGRDLLTELVQTRQDQIKRSLSRNKLSRAGTYLDETSRLIRKYNLTGQTQTQAALEQDYRQASEAVQRSSSSTASTHVLVTQQETEEQTPAIVAPPPAEGERYVTPVGDLNVVNQFDPTTNQTTEQPLNTEASRPPQRSTTTNQARVAQKPPRAPIVQNTEIIEQQPQPAPTQLPEPVQAVTPQVAPAPAPQASNQPEELPAESVIQAPAAVSVSTGTITKGVLDTEGAAAPPTEAEIPDSERK